MGNYNNEQVSSWDKFIDKKQSNTVICLGITFENNEARRAYFSEELRKKLPELKKIKGFPIGSDEDILAMSNPPYYTACPNPFISAFIKEWEKEKKAKYGEEEEYHQEPLTIDVSEGKNDPLYGIPSYYTKVPPKAILRYLLHYTKPGDVILDCFSGTGMTGLATRLCNSKASLKAYGYTIKDDKIISEGKYVSDFGERKSVLVDLSPYATYVSAYMNSPFGVNNNNKYSEFKAFIETEISPLYMTNWNGEDIEFEYAIWSDWSTCEECGQTYNLFNNLIDWENKVMRKEIKCSNCGFVIDTEGLKKVFESEWDQWIGDVVKKAKSSLVWISRLVNNRSDRKDPTQDDIDKYISIADKQVNYIPQKLNYRHMTHERNNLPKYWGITHIHQFYTKRNYYALDKIISYCMEKKYNTGIFCALSIIENNATKRNRFYVDNRRPKGSPIGPLSNTLYVPGIQVETNIGKKVVERIEDLKRVEKVWPEDYSIVSTQSASKILQIPDSSIDFIFTDPPFGGNINYSEQSILTEWWLKLETNNECEAITNNVQNKGVQEYQALMTLCFQEYYRVLKPNRWMVVEFHNSSNKIWNCIQQALERAGFIVASVSLLDKQHDTLHQDSKAAAVNKDLVITVYKPTLELNLSELGDTINEKYVWDFIENHLRQLPVYNQKVSILSERTKFVLFDRMVGFYIQKGSDVPISAADFYYGLKTRYIERDEMFFLSDQVYIYDKKKASMEGCEQVPLFISDERSAIEWLNIRLKSKPQTFQEIHPAFMKEISTWNKFDTPLELSALLEQNLIQYSGDGPVPSQIHSYLSSNYKDMRELDKEDNALRQKAKNRWYVPDPNKQADLEKLREKSLLREFGTYIDEVSCSKKKLKQFRLEAIRVGFKKAWADKAYQTIVDIASKIPEAVLQEDDKLLMYYDNAQIRLDT